MGGLLWYILVNVLMCKQHCDAVVGPDGANLRFYTFCWIVFQFHKMIECFVDKIFISTVTSSQISREVKSQYLPLKCSVYTHML